MGHIPFQNDPWLSDWLSCVDDIEIEEILLSALLPCNKVLLTLNEQFVTRLSLEVDYDYDNRDAEEQNLQSCSEHSSTEDLGE